MRLEQEGLAMVQNDLAEAARAAEKDPGKRGDHPPAVRNRMAQRS